MPLSPNLMRPVAALMALALLVLPALSGRAPAGEAAPADEAALVAVAANFTGVLRTLVPLFHAQTGYRVEIASGATGALYAQIRAGAPFDILLAADQVRPARLVEEGFAVAGSRFTYAVGRLTLWSATPGFFGGGGAQGGEEAQGAPAACDAGKVRGVDVADDAPDDAPGAASVDGGSRAIWADGAMRPADAPGAGRDDRAAVAAALTSGALRHLAMADPDLAPYGAAARATLTALGLRDALAGRIVLGQNAGQAFAMVATGNAGAGLVALSAVLGRGGSRWDVPASLYPAIRQDAVLLRAGQGHAAATAFMAFLRGETAARIIAAAGYALE